MVVTVTVSGVVASALGTAVSYILHPKESS